MIAVNTGEIIANINVDIRLAIPISELYRLFLERHPTEKRQIEELRSRRVVESASEMEHAKQLQGAVGPGAGAGVVHPTFRQEDESRLYNELEIVILKGIGLPPSADGSQPTAYVHFQLLGNPDKFTNPVPNTSEPSFGEKFIFPMVTNDQQLRLLHRSKLLLTVIDMKGEELEDENEGLIGECSVSLADVAEGLSVFDHFNVQSRSGKKTAELQLSLRWRNTFRRQRELGPRALSGVEVEKLISDFAAGEHNEGVVDYHAFCRFIAPPPGNNPLVNATIIITSTTITTAAATTSTTTANLYTFFVFCAI